MAKKDDKKQKKIVLERVYNVPLRKKYRRAPRWKRTNRAVKAVREFVIKNMKSDSIKIGKYANLELWKHGIRNPPHHIKVICKKDEDGMVNVELVGAPEEKPKKQKKAKKEKEEEVEIKVKEALGEEEEKIEKLEKKEEEIKEEKAEKAKEIEKEEIQELKKEHPRVHHPQAMAPKEIRMDIKKTQSAPEKKR